MSSIIAAGGVVSVIREGVCSIRVMRYPDGRLAFAKGRVEEGETLEQTALREVEEEAGLGGLQIVQALGTVGYRSKNPQQSMHEKVMHIFLMTATESLGGGEEGACWVPLEEAITTMELEGERALLTKNATLLAQHSSPESIWV